MESGSRQRNEGAASQVSPMQRLLRTLPQIGTLEWIGVRPGRRESVRSVEAVKVPAVGGLEGDHFRSTKNNTRQVTLIQAEHLETVGSLLGREPIEPRLVRRNLVVRGINLLALKGRRFRIGEVVLEATGPCAPCSFMEEVLGPGGYNAMRGHGGITARVIEPGTIRIGDRIQALEADVELPSDED